jgi:hypothetical protein
VQQRGALHFRRLNLSEAAILSMAEILLPPVSTVFAQASRSLTVTSRSLHSMMD